MAPTFDPKLFDWLGNRPSAWFGLADTLLKSAALVWERRNEIPHSVWVALMLRGYAVENLFKGRWVQKGNALSESGRYQRIPGIGDHNLVQTANTVGLSCSEPRTNVLHALTNAIRYLGRYPVPLNHHQMAVHTAERPDEKSLWCPDYEAEFWSLVSELAGGFKFLEELPGDFVANVMETTWRRPCTPTNP